MARVARLLGHLVVTAGGGSGGGSGAATGRRGVDRSRLRLRRRRLRRLRLRRLRRLRLRLRLRRRPPRLLDRAVRARIGRHRRVEFGKVEPSRLGQDGRERLLGASLEVRTPCEAALELPISARPQVWRVERETWEEAETRSLLDFQRARAVHAAHAATRFSRR